jgi:hypothetical protein
LLDVLSSGTGAGTSDWVQGAALLLCTLGSGGVYTQPQPCIQTTSFFLQAPSTIGTSFGWTAPSATNTNAGPLIVGAQVTNTNYAPTSALSVGSLRDTTISGSQPDVATVTGTLTSGDLISISSPSSGLYDLIDSGIALSSGKISTSSLTGVLSTSNGGTGTGSNFAAHQFFGNSTTSAAAPAAFLLSTNDTSVNWYGAGSGTANVQTVTLPVTSPATLSLASGLEVHWLPTAANTSSTPTLAVNGLTAHNITKCGTAALAPNDLTTAAIARAVYDGTNFQLQNPQAQPCGTVVPLCVGASENIPASSTAYIAFGTASVTETSAPMPVPVSGTALTLHAWANGTLPYTVTVQARYNGANLTNLSCTLNSTAQSCDSATPGTSTITEASGGNGNRWGASYPQDRAPVQ